MIHYALACAAGHEFDGWFASAASFDQQAASHRIACPRCASTEITRALMAPALRRTAPEARPPAPDPQTLPAARPIQCGSMPADMLSMLQKLRATVEATCHDAGHEFASLALRMHRGEIPPEPIYGQTSADEAESLADQGVEIARLPWVPRAES